LQEGVQERAAKEEQARRETHCIKKMMMKKLDI
jgi:hypothetical protein